MPKFTADEAKDQLIKHEGFKLYPYRCTSGKLTIGIGRNLQDKGITKSEALFLFYNDLNECIADCTKIFGKEVWDNLSSAQQLVLVDMRFNLGPTRIRDFKNTISLIKAGHFDKASVEMLNSLWAKQVPARAKELARMLSA